MAKFNSFRDLEVWRAAMDLAVLCYRTTDAFPRGELYTLTAQIRRAVVSISANVAEGHNRKSRKAYRNHVSIALGSHAELESLLELAKRLDYLDTARLTLLEESIRRTGQMLYGLWRALTVRKPPSVIQAT
jgi:four helix bundle protein